MADDETDGEGYRLVLAFDSDDPLFARGWQAGCLYQALRDNHLEAYEQWVFGDNAEMVARIGEATGRRVSIEDHTEVPGDWVLAKFDVPGTAPIKEV